MKIEHEESLGNTIACMHHVDMLNDLNISMYAEYNIMYT